ncbi:hypothetical protein ACIRSS_01355 [Amycolatopsis sp. NPDC101161]|uniref:hypothetical protein n=1 Tax=Amycolatopsis sp. NPDC101161 TaxID=3363940 RepID=UPI003828C32D
MITISASGRSTTDVRLNGRRRFPVSLEQPDPFRRFQRIFVFPHPHDEPAQLGQFSIGVAITARNPAQFQAPPLPVRRRQVPVLGT